MAGPNCQLGIVADRMGAAAGELLAEACAVAMYASVDVARAAGCAFVVHGDARGVEILGLGDLPGRGVRTDFTSLDIRTGAGNCSRRQPLGRAVGRESVRVVDATAGLAGDTVLLACMGYHVVAIERSPVLAAVIADGLARARDVAGFAEMVNRIELRVGDARELFSSISEIDAVYVDPMFPPKRRASALPPKSVQVIRAIVGDDIDSTELVAAAQRAARRVAVKRPKYASPLAGEPSHTIESKLVRYDVYIAPHPIRTEVSS